MHLRIHRNVYFLKKIVCSNRLWHNEYKLKFTYLYFVTNNHKQYNCIIYIAAVFYIIYMSILKKKTYNKEVYYYKSLQCCCRSH